MSDTTNSVREDQLKVAATLSEAPCGSRVRFGARKRGARAYMAVAGGIDVPPVLGSRATHVTSRMGGLGGRPVRAGDELAVGRSEQDSGLVGRAWSAIIPLPDGGATVRVMRGPQDDRFPQNTVPILGSARYRITSDSDRWGTGSTVCLCPPVTPGKCCQREQRWERFRYRLQVNRFCSWRTVRPQVGSRSWRPLSRRICLARGSLPRETGSGSRPARGARRWRR